MVLDLSPYLSFMKTMFLHVLEVPGPQREDSQCWLGERNFKIVKLNQKWWGGKADFKGAQFYSSMKKSYWFEISESCRCLDQYLKHKQWITEHPLHIQQDSECRRTLQWVACNKPQNLEAAPLCSHLCKSLQALRPEVFELFHQCTKQWCTLTSYISSFCRKWNVRGWTLTAEQRVGSPAMVCTPQRTLCLSHALKNVVSCRDLLSLFRKNLLCQKKSYFLWQDTGLALLRVKGNGTKVHFSSSTSINP